MAPASQCLSILLMASLATLALARISPSPQEFRSVIKRIDPSLPAEELVRRSYLRAKQLSSRMQYFSSARGSGSGGSSSSGGSNSNLAEGSLQQVNGGFTMEVLIGTPPQRLDVLFDTGSDLVWVDCNADDGDGIFQFSTSTSFSGVRCNDPRCEYVSTTECNPNCEYVYQYGGGAETYGRFSSETFSLPSTNRSLVSFPGILFGCGDENYGFDELHGIAGFGPGAISLMTQLGSSISSKFSYCLSSNTNSSPLFYGSSAAIHEQHVQTTPILSSSTGPSFYFLNVTGIAVAGSRIVMLHDAFQRTGGTIFDSGTTLTFLPQGVYSRVRRAFSSRITLPEVDGSDWGLDLCYDTSSEHDYVFPSLRFDFDLNASMSPAQENYFFAPTGGSTVCLGISSSDGLGINVIGNVMQQGFHILYDTTASTISFAAATCERLRI